MESVKTDTRNASDHAIVEARLRAELSLATEEKNEALQSSRAFQAKSSLLSEQLQQVKNKLSRAIQEKIQIEREQRTSMSLTKSLETHQRSTPSAPSKEIEQYKLKVIDLENQVTTLKNLVAQKNARLEELGCPLKHTIGDEKSINTTK